MTLGMTTSSGMVTAMMDDATDGVMNGMMGSTAISMDGMGGMMGGTMMQGTAGTSSLGAGDVRLRRILDERVRGLARRLAAPHRQADRVGRNHPVAGRHAPARHRGGRAAPIAGPRAGHASPRPPRGSSGNERRRPGARWRAFDGYALDALDRACLSGAPGAIVVPRMSAP